MARTVRRKTKDDVMLDRERTGGADSRKKNISRNNKKNRLRQIDYTDPSVLEELEDEYDY